MINNIASSEIGGIRKNWLIWWTLGNQDIKLKYRRSTLGPFWITLSTAISIYSMGFLYGHLFKANLALYFPHLAAGIIGWAYISSLLEESGRVFIESQSYITNQESMLSMFIMRMLLRNLIIFCHNLAAFIPIAFIFKTGLSLKMLMIFPGLMIIGINTLFWGTILGLIATRYRDFQQILSSILRVMFFLTPIMWMPSLLPSQYQWIALYNPLNQFLNLIRSPMLNESISSLNLIIVMLITALGFVLYNITLRKHKHKLVFWI